MEVQTLTSLQRTLKDVFYVGTIPEYRLKKDKLPAYADVVLLAVSLTESVFAEDMIDPMRASVAYAVSDGEEAIDLLWPLELRDDPGSGFVPEMGTECHAFELFVRHHPQGPFIVQALPRGAELGRVEFIGLL